MNYSQLNQDVNVLKFFNFKENGYYVEIGASDGIELSNTYLLESKFNWTGICVEPLHNRFELLKNNRPNSVCVNKAVFSESGLKLNFDISNNNDLLSGISSHINFYNKFVDSNKTTIIVETITLNDLLEMNNAPKFIDYLSLDTEGSEFEILKSVDLNIYTFGLIDVEHNFVEPQRSEINNYLVSNGYTFLRENKWDDCYVHNSLNI